MLTCGAMLLQPRIARGAAVVTVVMLAISLVVADPAQGFRGTPSTGWWSVSVQDLERAVVGAAFAPAALVLASAWVTIAVAWLRSGRRMMVAGAGYAHAAAGSTRGDH